ncbi:hypothetical protein GALL_512330 [mine drainage metagenome]|uniref:Uncharacterized protein n=1 Tax=mine drainage metagenome TaxID=410659 RepID=A0A1J5PUG4_9ZZZZ
MRVGMICLEPAISASLSSRASGTATSPTFGSMVQKGKFAACAAAVRVSALKSVDLPTFGMPTIPILKPIVVTPLIGNAPRLTEGRAYIKLSRRRVWRMISVNQQGDARCLLPPTWRSTAPAAKR